MYIYDNITIENQENIKYGNQRNFGINIRPQHNLGVEFTAC